jgi:hypothetical protein
VHNATPQPIERSVNATHHPETAGQRRTSPAFSCVLTAVTALWLGVAAGQVLARDYSVLWFSVDGGSGASGGGRFSLSGTIGQPDAGTLTGGSFTLQGGFWALPAAVPPFLK